ncbi:MAG: quinone-dependent dihydroorotate dehydrogenase [Candidatus Magasanikbacteria bacterium]
MLYRKIIRPILFKTDPEKVHHFVIRLLGAISVLRPFYFLIKKFLFVDDPRLHVQIGNLKLKNPVGLSAGFDKDIIAPLAYPMLGFGFAELGSITNSAQPGNPKPRLWRIPDDKGLIVYYGLCNCGSLETARRIKKKLVKRDIPYGVSIAVTTGLKADEMADDYVKSFLDLYELADYITLNVSCPNVASCDVFAQVSFIKELLEKINKIVKERNISKDIFVKIGPDMSYTDLDKIIDLCLEYKITGIIATNLIKNRSWVQKFKSSKEKLNHPGGISGKHLQQRTNNIIHHISERSKGQLKIIGVGGIFTAQDVYDKLKAGACAVQMITGFIYGGPFTIRKINKDLIKILDREGVNSLGDIK